MASFVTSISTLRTKTIINNLTSKSPYDVYLRNDMIER